MCVFRCLRTSDITGYSQRLWPGSRRWGRRGWVLPAYRTSSLDSPAPTLERGEEEKRRGISSRFSRPKDRKQKKTEDRKYVKWKRVSFKTAFAGPLTYKRSHATWSPNRTHFGLYKMRCMFADYRGDQFCCLGFFYCFYSVIVILLFIFTLQRPRIHLV